MRNALAMLIVVGLAAPATAQPSSGGEGAGGARSASTSRNGSLDQVPGTPATRTAPAPGAAPSATLVPTRPLRNSRTPQEGSAREPEGAVDDNLFAAAAAAGGMYEVTSSKIALMRGHSEHVKQFAQQMVNDHTKANHELMALAAQKQIPLPKGLDIKDRACENILAGLSGERFDHCYAKQQDLAHKGTIALFEAEAERGRDPELKAWAAKTLPTLKAHEKHVKMLVETHVKEKSSAH